MASRTKKMIPVISEVAAQQVLDIQFDLSRISFDELCDVLEVAGKDEKTFSGKDFASLIHTMRTCVTGSSRPMTGDDAKYVLQAFIQHVNGNSIPAKN